MSRRPEPFLRSCHFRCCHRLSSGTGLDDDVDDVTSFSALGVVEIEKKNAVVVVVGAGRSSNKVIFLVSLFCRVPCIFDSFCVLEYFLFQLRLAPKADDDVVVIVRVGSRRLCLGVQSELGRPGTEVGGGE